MKQLSLILIATLCLVAFAQAKAPSHETWNELLKKHVSIDGKVNYKGFKADSEKLNQYLTLLSANKPDEKLWTKDEQKCYWINAYNAFTIKLIIDNYPVKSINDVAKGIANSPWDIKFIKIGNESFSLNVIEHEKLRKSFGDARFHFALVCAAKSCPILLNEAYTVDKLEIQLDKQSRLFINDKVKNNITKTNIKISKIFEWYADDFKSGNNSVIDFINKYATVKINADASVSYLEYNWDLNQ